MTGSGSSHSVIRSLGRNWAAILLYWDFLFGVAAGVALVVIDFNLASDKRQGFHDGVAAALGDAPTFGMAALALAIATLTFLSSIARSRLFQSAARSGALTDFATFSWWEGFIAVVSIVLFALLPVLPPVWTYVEAALVLYVLLGLLGLLLRLTHIVYRHAGALAEDGPPPAAEKMPAKVRRRSRQDDTD